MGSFFENDDNAPDIQMTPYTPVKAAEQFSPINFMQIMDDISGEEFTFIRGTDSKRYLEVKEKLGAAEHELSQMQNGPAKLTTINQKKEAVDNLKRELADAKSQSDSENAAKGVKDGQVRVRTRDTRNRIPLDAPINVNDVDVNLPLVGNLREFTMRYAAAVANVTSRLRDLSKTIDVAENLDPMLIQQNQGLITAFRNASNKAMEKGFDIKNNGIDLKLRQMGLLNSSTALGTQIALARERTDAEIQTALSTAQLAQGAKQQTIDNMFKRGQQMVQEGTIELNKYGQESTNELNARQQDLGKEQLIQQRGSEQAKLNLSKEQMKVQAEVARRNLQLGLMRARNPAALAFPHLANMGAQSLGAIQGDNNAMHNVQSNQLQKSQLDLQKFQYEQAAKSNPFETLLTTGISTGLGSFAGGFGTAKGLIAGGYDINDSAKSTRPYDWKPVKGLPWKY